MEATDAHPHRIGDLPHRAARLWRRANTVAVRNGVLAVGYQNADSSQNGAVALFDAASLALIGTPLVGRKPARPAELQRRRHQDPRCNEGERATVNGSPVNPTGSVSLIDLTAGAAAATVSTYDFGSLAGQEDTFERLVSAFRQGRTRLPTSSRIHDDRRLDGLRDLAGGQHRRGLRHLGLGTGPHGPEAARYDRPRAAGNELDASDDGPATRLDRLRNEPVLGLPMPDAIASFTAADGRVYFITANEGDARSDDSDCRASGHSALDPTAFPERSRAQGNTLSSAASTSRPSTATRTGRRLRQIYAFGGRGISIFRQETDGTITKVRETGGVFEKIIARDAAAIFNQNQGDGSVDARSDDKGPEPEGVTVGNIAGRTYAFVGLERTGGVMVYDVTVPAEARFVTFQPPASGTTDAGPEVLTFISAADSPTGQALVVFANEVGNTTTVYQAAPALTAIPLIQGTGATSSFAGQTVTTRASSRRWPATGSTFRIGGRRQRRDVGRGLRLHEQQAECRGR